MRIITGKYKGRVIKMPKGIRPTQDKVRKALFDILGDMQGLSFLELFSGSGAIGIEALSRGAKEAVFVDNDQRCIEAIKGNLLLFSATFCGGGRLCYRVIRSDALGAIKKLEKRGEKFDIIFLDPPYYMDWSKKALQMLGACDILAPNGFIIAQHFKKDELAKEAGGFRLIKESRYGDTVLSFYRK